jgi:DNA primase
MGTAGKRFALRPVLQHFGVTVHGDGTQQVRCPVHEDRSPSARYYADGDRVHCFACGQSWDAVGLVMAKLKLPYAMAVGWLETQFRAEMVPLSDQVRAAVRPVPVRLAASPMAVLDVLDQQVRQVEDGPTAVRLWKAVDHLRAQAQAGEAVGPMVTALRRHVQGAMRGVGRG